MLIYNVTLNVDDSIHEDWLSWMKTVHIPEVLQTGCFTHHYFTRILTTQQDESGFTYSIQYHCPSAELLDVYQEKHAPKLQREHLLKYEGHFVAFRTILEKVKE